MMVLDCTGRVLPVVRMPLRGYHASNPSVMPWARAVLVGVIVRVYVGVGVAVAVYVGVGVAVAVYVGVWIAVAVYVGVRVAVLVRL